MKFKAILKNKNKNKNNFFIVFIPKQILGKLREITFYFLDSFEDFLDTIFAVQTHFYFHHLIMTQGTKLF